MRKQGTPHWRAPKEVQRRAQELRRELTPPELRLWQQLPLRRLTAPASGSSTPSVRIVDFYCAKAKLVVEVDGDSPARQMRYDEARTQWLMAKGSSVIRFTNREVIDQLHGVVEAIAELLGGPPP